MKIRVKVSMYKSPDEGKKCPQNMSYNSFYQSKVPLNESLACPSCLVLSASSSDFLVLIGLGSPLELSESWVTSGV